jgi:hypothetical protein
VFPYENLVKNLNLEIEKWKINIFNEVFKWKTFY